MNGKEENIFTLHGKDLRHMILEACNYFEQHKESINDLNVFPVPDGDTGTNMSLTLKAAADALLTFQSESIGEVAGIAARSSLMGARGNSGVIFSQLFRGIARGLTGKDEATLYEVGRAFQYGIVYAYNAVSKPIEGTILTVAREIARGSREAVQSSLNFAGLLQIALECGKKALDQTPELLPALKEAGVVDAGGLGLIVFLEGCLQSILKGATGDGFVLPRGIAGSFAGGGGPIINGPGILEPDEQFDERYPYCTEFLIRGGGLSVGKIRKDLVGQGDSLLVAGEEEIVKVHIHTDDPGNILQICLQCGSLHDIKIDNMADQFKETRWGRTPGTGEQDGASGPAGAGLEVDAASVAAGAIIEQIGIVAVSPGKGLAEMFTSLGADGIIAGGQSMNPSVEDIVKAIESLAQEMVLILPNNNNIRFAAGQAVKLVEKEVAVVDTRSVPQGIAALLAFDRDASLSLNHTRMCKRALQVKTGEVTFAVRDAHINNIEIKENDIIGLSDGDLLFRGENVDETTMGLIGAMLTGEEELLTLFYGQEISSAQVELLAGQISKAYPFLDVEFYNGGQPLYYYFISLE
ncbi:MAG TPA: DAK2 domain-containing protein [Firmicutes bacterium]|jgi:DAK2 domain fusion protein YloV|nr:DAK2 domain-containing protein [Bacillota bacterium]